jgi:hypothetical protein
VYGVKKRRERRGGERRRREIGVDELEKRRQI